MRTLAILVALVAAFLYGTAVFSLQLFPFEFLRDIKQMIFPYEDLH